MYNRNWSTCKVPSFSFPAGGRESMLWISIGIIIHGICGGNKREALRRFRRWRHSGRSIFGYVFELLALVLIGAFARWCWIGWQRAFVIHRCEHRWPRAVLSRFQCSWAFTGHGCGWLMEIEFHNNCCHVITAGSITASIGGQAVHEQLSGAKTVQCGSAKQTKMKFTSSQIWLRLFFCKRSRTKFTASWLDMKFQIPSQAMIMNSSWSSSVNVRMSGSAVIACSSAGNADVFLYAWSPIARDKFRPPRNTASVRPHSVMEKYKQIDLDTYLRHVHQAWLCIPPFLYDFSRVDLLVYDLVWREVRDERWTRTESEKEGWYEPKLISIARPARQTTHRESPAFATYNCLSRKSANTAVHPLDEPGSLLMSNILPRSASPSSSTATERRTRFSLAAWSIGLREPSSSSSSCSWSSLSSSSSSLFSSPSCYFNWEQ